MMLPDFPDTLQAAVDWLSALLQLAAALALAWGFVAGSRRLLGRRRALANKLRSLVAGARVDYFEQVLGQAPFRRPASRGTTSYTWVEPEVYVNAAVREEVVRVYSVTVRRRWFRPKLGNFLGSPPGPFRLGSTAFSAVDSGHEPREIRAFLGARRHGYGEIFYFGNPGGYREFAFAINDAGPVNGRTSYIELVRAGEGLAQLEEDDPRREDLLRRIRQDRRDARFNTYAVSAPGESITKIMKEVIGVNLDEVRVMDDYLPAWRRAPILFRLWRFRRSLRRDG